MSKSYYIGNKIQTNKIWVDTNCDKVGAWQVVDS